jgi:general secretion pathway protein D
LIITAPEPLYRQLRAVIDQLDSRRAQVYIESMIVKVDAKKAAEFGFQWQGLLGKKGDNTLLVAGTNFPGANNIINLSTAAGSGTPVAPGNGLNVGLVRNFGGVYTLASLAQFLESNTSADILSTPNLVSLDNEEAKIVIGQNVPFITGSFTNTGGSGSGATNPFQTIERKDVGLTLRVKPQIGEGGTVRMTIYQESSAVLKELTSAAGPTTDKSSIETTVVVDDGQIMVLGGLLKDEYSGGSTKVPGFGDIPLVGSLFRSDSRERTKTNLMVFLRPVVIRTQEAANSLTIDRYDIIRAKQQDVQPKPSAVIPINEAPVLPERPAIRPGPSPAPSPAPSDPDPLINR